MASPALSAQGFYKDIFMDSGILLTSRVDLPASRYLDLSMEEFVSANHRDTTTALTARDTLLQTMMIAGSPIDENGILLYPDGAPRFRVYYMNGGRAGSHGKSLGAEARDNIRRYIAAGGSYVGTCAGAFCASAGARSGANGDSTVFYPGYLGIFPGYTRGTALSDSQTDMTLPKKSPLLKYYSFGGDGQIDSVRHNGGCFLYTLENCPPETEILARYETGDRELKRKIDGECSIWAYKASDESGRVVCCGSHPEGVNEGERLELMCAMLRYAMDGNGEVRIKGSLADGEERLMTKTTSEADPDHTAIGDRQYHHFTVEVPKGAESVTVTLAPKKGWEDFDLYLFADSEGLAFSSNAERKDITPGASKQLVIPAPPKGGTVYVSVYCATTVDTIQTRYGTQYYGRTDVLNGVPYIIKAEIK